MESRLEKLLPKKNKWIIMLLIGILLVVIALPSKGPSVEMSGNEGTGIEGRLEQMLMKMKGVGEVHVMITYNDDSVEGVVVVAEGGGNSIVTRNITDVVRALFNVDSHKIKVIEQKSK